MRISDWSSDVCSSDLPLRLDQAEGRWTYGGGVLGISAPSARIRDAADERRFEPVSARDVKLALEDGVIRGDAIIARPKDGRRLALVSRSEEHTSELQSLMSTSYDVSCMTKKT